MVQLSWKKGDVEDGFRSADLIVENTFQTQVVHQAYIEPHSCVVKANESGGAEIWACSKVPFALRDQMATAFGIAAEKFWFIHVTSAAISAARATSWTCRWRIFFH